MWNLPAPAGGIASSGRFGARSIKSTSPADGWEGVRITAPSTRRAASTAAGNRLVETGRNSRAPVPAAASASRLCRSDSLQLSGCRRRTSDPSLPPPRGRRLGTPTMPPSGIGAEGETTRTSEIRLPARSEEHTSELQSRENLVCRLLLEKKKRKQ